MKDHLYCKHHTKTIVLEKKECEVKFCKEHNVDFCRCGWEFGSHPEVEVKIKQICPSCDKKFKNSKKRYMIKGNYCNKCIIRINEMASLKNHLSVCPEDDKAKNRLNDLKNSCKYYVENLGFFKYNSFAREELFAKRSLAKEDCCAIIDKLI